MNTRMQPENRLDCIVTVLGLILVASLVVTVTLMILDLPVSELLVAIGVVAGSGLARLLIPSPLNGGLFR